MKALGMTVLVDAVGNLAGIYCGTPPGAPRVLMGRIWTRAERGSVDGILGVVARGRAGARSAGRRKLPFEFESSCFFRGRGRSVWSSFIGSRALWAGWMRNFRSKDERGISVRRRSGFWVEIPIAFQSAAER